MKFKLLSWMLLFGFCSNFAQQKETLKPYILIVQPIIVQSDEGTNPASMALPEKLVDNAYKKAKVDFLFLEPIYFNNTKARDGKINLDKIIKIAEKKSLLKGQNDIVNMFFVNKIDGKKGPLGRGMQGGNITFIALGDNSYKQTNQVKKYMQAFVIAHEVGHNLDLHHAVDDPKVPNNIPNIEGDGKFEDRINPKYSLTNYQIDIVHKSPLVHPRIEFLSKKKAEKGILDESFEPYFSQLQKREIETFIQEKIATTNMDEIRAFAKKKFASAVASFSENEKNCISFVVKKVTQLLQKNGIQLMAKHPWRFIKIEDWLCGGFAHTRGTYIIISQRHFNYLSKGWSNHMTKEQETKLIENFGGLLVHEQMHSLQRTYKSKFIKLYTKYWDFIQAKVKSEKAIKLDQVSNPDAPIAEWLIPNKNKKNSYYWIRTLLKKGIAVPVMGKDFIDKVFTVQKTNKGYRVKKDINGKPIYTTLSEIAFYKNSFPVTRGLDHPNEIAAYMFSNYFRALVSQTTPFKNASPTAIKNSRGFVDWINKEMK